MITYYFDKFTVDFIKNDPSPLAQPWMIFRLRASLLVGLKSRWPRTRSCATSSSTFPSTPSRMAILFRSSMWRSVSVPFDLRDARSHRIVSARFGDVEVARHAVDVSHNLSGASKDAGVNQTVESKIDFSMDEEQRCAILSISHSRFNLFPSLDPALTTAALGLRISLVGLRPSWTIHFSTYCMLLFRDDAALPLPITTPRVEDHDLAPLPPKVLYPLSSLCNPYLISFYFRLREPRRASFCTTRSL